MRKLLMSELKWYWYRFVDGRPEYNFSKDVILLVQVIIIIIYLINPDAFEKMKKQLKGLYH